MAARNILALVQGPPVCIAWSIVSGVTWQCGSNSALTRHVGA